MKDYINGSDLLLGIGADRDAVCHSTSHTTTFNAETKERAVKPIASKPASASVWKEKGITGKSVTISAEGLRFGQGQTEYGFPKFLDAYDKMKPIRVVAYERGDSEKPYIDGYFIITSLEETTPAQDDATYSVTLENTGEVKFFPENLSQGPDPDDDSNPEEQL